MPKSSQKQIDNDEKKVVRELQKNSKESIDKIAKRGNQESYKHSISHIKHSADF